MIKIILTIGLVILLPISIREWSRSRIISLTLLFAIIFGLYFIWNSDQTTIVAHMLGVGRGADLLLYAYILVSLILIVKLGIAIRANNRLVSELAQQIALSNLYKPEKKLIDISKKEDQDTLDDK